MERKLLTLLMFSAVLLNAVFIIIQTYQIILSITFHYPCDVFLPQWFYITFNILYGFSIELSLLSKAMLIMERSLATVYVDSYENWRCSTGILGVIASILLAIAVELYIYIGASFDPEITAIGTSDDVAVRINNVLIFNVSCSAATMTIMVALLFVNNKRKGLAIGCISHRFQIEENIVTTKFIAKIAFVQLIAFSLQSLGSLLLRLNKESFKPSDYAFVKTLKLLLQVMPLFTIIMSIVIEWSICTTTKRRRARVLNMVNIRDSAHYSSRFLANQWNSIVPKVLEKSNDVAFVNVPHPKFN